MYSARTRWDFTPNRLARALDARRARGLPLLDLTESNPTRAGIPGPPDDALAALASRAVRRYAPDPRGLRAARDAVASYYRDRGLVVDPERVVLSASTSEAYGWLFKLLCDPGDAVLVPRPSYPLFDDLARLEGVELVPYALAWEGRWRLDPEALARAVTPRCRAALFVHPNNPTGSFLARAELDAVRAIARARDLALIADEVFGDYAFAPDPARVSSFVTVTDVPCFTLSGLSKVAALPQMKLAWTVLTGPEPALGQALRRLEHLADCYLSVGAPVAAAAGALLASRHAAQEAILARVRANRAELVARAAPPSRASVLHADGGWYAVLRVPATSPEDELVATLVAEDGVLVHPGYFFDFPAEARLVLSLLTPEEDFREGLARLLARIERD